MLKKIFKIVRLFVPLIIILGLKKTKIYSCLKKIINRISEEKNNSSWVEVKSGFLKGFKILIDPNGLFKEMVQGTYDDFIFDYLKKLNLEGKIIYDIGAHIGFSALGFSRIVGQSGKVISFEPNSYNRERMEEIISQNPSVGSIIEVSDLAVSDKNGEEDFVFSDNVDGGTSSGSFIDSADTFWEKDVYEKNIGFKRVKVKTITLNDYIKDHQDLIPALIKMDIEGAEHLAILGGLEVIKKNKIKLLIEVHSMFNMFKLGQLFDQIDYKMELLKEEKDGRCFVAALPK